MSDAALLLLSICDILKWYFSVSDIDMTRAQTSDNRIISQIIDAVRQGRVGFRVRVKALGQS